MKKIGEFGLRSTLTGRIPYDQPEIQNVPPSKQPRSDPWRELAATMFNVAYDAVTVEQRRAAKAKAFRFLYESPI